MREAVSVRTETASSRCTVPPSGGCPNAWLVLARRSERLRLAMCCLQRSGSKLRTPPPFCGASVISHAVPRVPSARLIANAEHLDELALGCSV